MEKSREDYKPRLDRKMALGIIGFSILGQIAMWMLTWGVERRELADMNNIATLPLLPGITIQKLGIFFLVFAVIWSALEKKDDLPFFYGVSQSGGTNINSSGLCALGITGVATRSLWHYLMWLIIMLVVILGERYYIDQMRYNKIQKYWEATGVAKTDIDYKGKAQIGDELLKVRIRKNAIKAGTPVMVAGIEGFMLVVEPLD